MTDGTTGTAPSIGDRWRALSPGARAVVVVVGVVVGANLAAAGGRAASGSGPRGAPSSSFATTPEGLSAWATLLSDNGHPVRRWREPLDEVPLDPSATLVVADPVGGLAPAEFEAVVDFVRAGGRLVAAGATAIPLARRVVPDLEWAPDGPETAVPVAPVPEVAGIDGVRFAGSGRFDPVGSGLPLLAGADLAGEPGAPSVVGVVAGAGDGRVVALASSLPLRNRVLAAADNAAFALRLAGERARPVHFGEAAHGYDDSGGLLGLAALPGRWPVAVVTAASAATVWAWSRARRFGPPDDEPGVSPPPRRLYVDAMAAVLARTDRPAEATAALRDRARSRLAARLGLAGTATVEEIGAAATRAGWEPDLVDAVLGPVFGEAEMLALGRAVARLEVGT